MKRFWTEIKCCRVLQVNDVKDEFFELLPSEYWIDAITETYFEHDPEKVVLTFKGWYNTEDFSQ